MTSRSTRAWLDGDGNAPSRIRPALGQPTSPIRMSLPGNDAPTCRRIDITWSAAARPAIGIVLPIRQDVDGHEIDRGEQIAIAQPEFPDIRIGHRHRHLPLDLADDVGQRRGGQFAAQQHLVADDDRADRRPGTG